MRDQTLRDQMADLEDIETMTVRQIADKLGVGERGVRRTLATPNARPRRARTQPGATEPTPADQGDWEDWEFLKEIHPGITAKQAAVRMGTTERSLHRLAQRVREVKP